MRGNRQKSSFFFLHKRGEAVKWLRLFWTAGSRNERFHDSLVTIVKGSRHLTFAGHCVGVQLGLLCST